MIKCKKRLRRLRLEVSKKAKRVDVDWKDEKGKKYWNDKLNIKKKMEYSDWYSVKKNVLKGEGSKGKGNGASFTLKERKFGLWLFSFIFYTFERGGSKYFDYALYTGA